MKRNVVLALVVMAALLLAGGAALAATITCDSATCEGTRRADQIDGRSGVDDKIVGRGGNDKIADSFNGTDADVILGGKGDDRITVREGLGGGPDFVDCGPGKDTVFLDAAAFSDTDTAVNCERINPDI